MNQAKFDEQFSRFQEMSVADGRFSPQVSDHFPHLNDDGIQGYEPHYLLHTSWMARKVAEAQPIVHHDFGSSLFFAGIVSAFVTLYYYDIRKPNIPLPGIREVEANLTKLPMKDGELISVSSGHVIEHIGLGRYGDELDASGDRKAAKELMRVLAPGRELIVAIPMEDPPRICFNAHRYYSYEHVMELFEGLTLTEFSLITERCQFFPHANPGKLKGEKNACGCFLWSKP